MKTITSAQSIIYALYNDRYSTRLCTSNYYEEADYYRVFFRAKQFEAHTLKPTATLRGRTQKWFVCQTMYGELILKRDCRSIEISIVKYKIFIVFYNFRALVYGVHYTQTPYIPAFGVANTRPYVFPVCTWTTWTTCFLSFGASISMIISYFTNPPQTRIISE